MADNVTRDEFDHLKARVNTVEREVEGEKMVTRHIFEQTRRNGDDLASIKRDVSVLKSDVAVLKKRCHRAEERCRRAQERRRRLEERSQQPAARTSQDRRRRDARS